MPFRRRKPERLRQEKPVYKKRMPMQHSLDSAWIRNALGPRVAEKVAKAKKNHSLEIIIETLPNNQQSILLETTAMHFELAIEPDKIISTRVKFPGQDPAISQIIQAKHSLGQKGRQRFFEEAKKMAAQIKTPKKTIKKYPINTSQKNGLLKALAFAMEEALINIEQQ